MRYEISDLEIRKRSRLQHWDSQHAIYFVTFNLFDAIPRDVRLRIREEAKAQLDHIRSVRGEPTFAESQAVKQWVNAQLSTTLDSAYGYCFMRDERIARI